MFRSGTGPSESAGHVSSKARLQVSCLGIPYVLSVRYVSIYAYTFTYMSDTFGIDPRLTEHACCAPYPLFRVPAYDVAAGVAAGVHLSVAVKPQRDTVPLFGAGPDLRARVSTRIASAAQRAHQHCQVVGEQPLGVVKGATDENVHVPNKVKCYTIQDNIEKKNSPGVQEVF